MAPLVCVIAGRTFSENECPYYSTDRGQMQFKSTRLQQNCHNAGKKWKLRGIDGRSVQNPGGTKVSPPCCFPDGCREMRHRVAFPHFSPSNSPSFQQTKAGGLAQSGKQKRRQENLNSPPGRGLLGTHGLPDLSLYRAGFPLPTTI